MPEYKRRVDVDNPPISVTRSYDFEVRTVRAVDMVSLRYGITRTRAVNDALQIGATLMVIMPVEVVETVLGGNADDIIGIFSPGQAIA